MGRLQLLFVCLAVLLTTACGTPMTHLRVESMPTTNGGRSLYMVVRNVSKDQFAAESYRDVEDIVFQKPADPSVLKSEVIFPGQPFETKIPQEQKQDVAVYFFFTKPGVPWSHPMPRPLPDSVRFRLKESAIGSIKTDP